VESIAERVSQAAIAIARDEYPLLDGVAAPPHPLPEIPADALVVPAHRTGWVQQFPLRAAAGCLPPGSTAIRHVVAGGHVAVGAPLATVWPAPARPAEVIRALQDRCDLGSTRTMQDDVGFGVTQMVDIAARALSPAINDTYTGLTCVDWLGDALVKLGSEPADTGGWSNDANQVRLVVPALHFDRLLKGAFDLIRQAGADSPAVLIRILDAIGTMAPMARPEHRDALRSHADLVIETARVNGLVSGDLADVDERYLRALRAFGE